MESLYLYARWLRNIPVGTPRAARYLGPSRVLPQHPKLGDFPILALAAPVPSAPFLPFPHPHATRMDVEADFHVPFHCAQLAPVHIAGWDYTSVPELVVRLLSLFS